MDEKKNTHGGKREGAGRKKTTEKRIGICVPKDIADILESVEGSKTDFICEAIRQYAKQQK